MYTVYAVRGFVFILARPPPLFKERAWMCRFCAAIQGPS